MRGTRFLLLVEEAALATANGQAATWLPGSPASTFEGGACSPTGLYPRTHGMMCALFQSDWTAAAGSVRAWAATASATAYQITPANQTDGSGNRGTVEKWVGPDTGNWDVVGTGILVHVALADAGLKRIPVEGLPAPPWESGGSYIVGDKVTHNGRIWECLFDGASAEPGTSGVWRDQSIPPLWVAPAGAIGLWDAGAVVEHNGQIWDNTHGDGNSWEPGVFGWTART